MKIINFGSLNIDKVYALDEFALAGQTVFAKSYETFAGGKGLNQSVAAARAGGTVIHAGQIGEDGAFLKDLLSEAGADTSFIRTIDCPTGHAVIEVDSAGQNKIVVFGGANQKLTEDYIDLVLKQAKDGDIVLLQNEINLISCIIKKASDAGAKVVFNPSPFPENADDLPLDLVDIFLVNEIEAAQLAGIKIKASNEEILDKILEKYPEAAIIMTIGDKGVLYGYKDERLAQQSFTVPVADTTAAGDTFTGYFLSALCRGKDIPAALELSCAASAIAVSKKGAAPSIPKLSEVSAFLLEERFEFRNIHEDEAIQAAKIEAVCFPPNEACPESAMKERALKIPELFLVAIDKQTGKIAGFLNGIATDKETFADEFFTDTSLYEPEGKNVMLLGLDVLPEYRRQGLASEIMRRYALREKENGRKRLILTCLDEKIPMYKKMGFKDLGLSASVWGGEAWHDMEMRLG